MQWGGGVQGPQAYSPRTTSLTVLRAMDRRDNAEERFFQLLEAEVDKVGRFTAQVVEGLRERLFLLQSRAREALSPEENNLLVAEAKTIGDEFLALEKFVNLNYMGFHKILKKHDKNLPQTPCRQFYISHLHNQPWVQGNYSDLLVALSNVYADLRGDVAPSDGAVDLDDEGYRYITSKYWVKMGDVSSVKHHILQHLPVYQFSENEYTGDSQLVNSVYLDNTSLEIYHALLNERPNGVEIRITWLGSQEPSEVTVDRKYKRYNAKGEEDVESFVLPEQMVVGFLEGDLSAALAKAYWSSKGLSSDDIQHNVELFDEVQRLVDAKQLKPLVRTQFMRTLFQIPFHPTVRIKLDTNINMMKENPEDGPTLGLAGRWYRDPALPVHRTEVTRFPHAVVELDLALEKGETTPDWVAELVESGTSSNDRFCAVGLACSTDI
jgi:SPX domain protein involved in polyphosphate accumulation